MSFKPKTETEYLMELITRDKKYFFNNLKALELNAWLFVEGSRN